MATLDLAIILDGILLPKFNDFERGYTTKEADVSTLGGSLYTDFTSVKRVWKIGWNLLTQENFNLINSIYLKQYTEFRYPTLQLDAYGIYCNVRMKIDDQKIKYNGSMIENFGITLIEKDAFS